MFTGSRFLVTRSPQSTGGTARRPGRPSLRRANGISTTEVVVISGMMVVTALLVMGIFRQEVTKAVTELSRCITGAVTGDVSACGGGGGGGGGTTTAGGPPKVPGMRDAGVAQGLVQAPPGKPGKPGAILPPGLGGPRNTAGAKDLANAKQMLSNFTRRINRGPQMPETAAETFSRWWNQTSIFGANRQLAASQLELEGQADRASRMTNQWLHTARQRLEAGDLNGFNEAMRNAQRYNNLQNTIEGRAASVLGDNADQGMTEAANIRQVSFATAAAIANPTGFVTGQVSGYVVSTAADQVLPDGRVKQVVVGVTTAALTAYAGGMTPGAWQNMGAVTATAGQAAGTFVNVADQVTSVVTTQQIHGNNEAAWEVITAGLTHAAMNTRSGRFADADGNPRTLNDYLTQAPSAQAVRNALENHAVPIGQLDANFQNIANHLKNEYAIATGGEANNAVTFKPLPPDPAYVQAIKDVQGKMPPLSDAEYAAAAKMGQTREMVDLKRAHAMVTGETMFDRETNVAGIQKIQDGEARGKSIYEHQKSGGDKTPFLPMDSGEAKPGQALAKAKQELAAATTPEARAQAQAKVDAAQRFVEQNNTWRDQALDAGHTKAVPNPDGSTRGPVAGDGTTGKPLVADVDSVTSSAARPGENVHNMGAHGMTTTSESQSLSNLQHTATAPAIPARRTPSSCRIPSCSTRPMVGPSW
jgi:hypothetical protein